MTRATTSPGSTGPQRERSAVEIEQHSTVLIVDDEVSLLDVLEAYLTDDGFRVLRAADGRAAVDLALRKRPDLILLDLTLPKLSGLEVFREIRAAFDVPIIMLTARAGEVDRVVGLELGADDYVTKPYSPREVVARVKTVLRRHRTAATEGKRAAHDVVSVGTLSVDRTSHDVRRGGEAVTLTPTEYRLLGVFIEHPGQVFSRDQLIDRVSRDGAEVFDRTLDRHVANLRGKIEIDPHRPRTIVTVFGVGYKLIDPAD